MPTNANVAKRANAAHSTVSCAINEIRPISAKTRARLFAAMAELAYCYGNPAYRNRFPPITTTKPQLMNWVAWVQKRLLKQTQANLS